MYKIEKFEVRDLAILQPVMDQYPFATVTTVTEGEPFISHLPITTEVSPDGQIRLLGHLSRRNPQWRHFQTGSPVLIAFHGPHTYINPGWYAENDVPTWNYIAIHAKGTAKLVEDYEGLLQILRKTTDHMNRTNQDQWDFFMPSDLLTPEDLTGAIIGFEMTPKELIGKFKLNQNRNLEDQRGVVAGLRNRSDEGSRAVAKWMAKLTE